MSEKKIQHTSEKENSATAISYNGNLHCNYNFDISSLVTHILYDA